MCLIAGSDCSIEGDDVRLKLLRCERCELKTRSCRWLSGKFKQTTPLLTVSHDQFHVTMTWQCLKVCTDATSCKLISNSSVRNAAVVVKPTSGQKMGGTSIKLNKMLQIPHWKLLGFTTAMQAAAPGFASAQSAEWPQSTPPHRH